MDICSYETFSILIKVFYLKALGHSNTFDQANRSLQLSLQAWHFSNFCKYITVLIIRVNNFNVCVLYFCSFSNKLYLFEATCSIILSKKSVVERLESKKVFFSSNFFFRLSKKKFWDWLGMTNTSCDKLTIEMNVFYERWY